MKEKWLGVNLYDEQNKAKISRIIQIELEIIEAIRAGHQAHWGDKFKEKRNEMLRLRKEITDGSNRN
jgi:hypothetical protein